MDNYNAALIAEARRQRLIIEAAITVLEDVNIPYGICTDSMQLTLDASICKLKNVADAVTTYLIQNFSDDELEAA